MKITITSSSIVKPAADTPNYILWNSNIDLVIPRIHIPTVYFYKTDGEGGQAFDCGHLKEALGRALVPFYPMAGRLKDKGKGRIDINCNGEGVLFVEALADGCLSEYGEYFAPCMKMRKLIPQVDYTQDNSSFPLVVLQVTFFKCGGVSLGVGVHHHVADGLGALRFLNYWSDVVRGAEEDVKLFIDRTLLRARNPPKPKFQHAEYQPPPLLLKAKERNGSNGRANGESITMNGDYSKDYRKVDSAYIKVNGDYSKVDCAYIKINGEHNKVDAAYIRKNGDYSKVDCVYIKVDGDFVRVNGKVNGDYVKAIASHGNGNGCYKVGDGECGNGFCSTGDGECGNANKALCLENGDQKMDGAYKNVSGDCLIVHGAYGNPNADDTKVNGDCRTLATDTNGAHSDKLEPPFRKLSKDDTHDKHHQPLEENETPSKDAHTEDYGPISAKLFFFSQEQINSLKKQAAEHALPGDRPFTSYEVLAAHIWRCACLARGLQDSQLTKLYIATDGRSRLQPPLPPDYFGNVIFTATPIEHVGQLVDAPLADVARFIRQTVQIMDDEYLRSAVDFLELQPNLADFSRGAHTFQTPNLGITSWVRLPIYGADFGWGPPLSMAPAGVPFEGLAYLLPGPPGDMRLRLSITLVPNHMLRFQELIHQI